MGSLTVLDLFENSSSSIHLDDDVTTARQLAEDGRRIATGFAQLGLSAGDRIAVWAPNGLAYLRCLAAAAAGRFVLVSINTRFGFDEAASIISRSGAGAVVTDRSDELIGHDIGGSASPIRVIPLDSIAPASFEVAAFEVAAFEVAAFEVAAFEVAPFGTATPGTAARPQPDDPFIVFTTSGTTSKPKLVLHHQKSIAIHAYDIPGRFSYDEASRVLVALPLCGVFGLDGLVGGLAANSEIWLPTRFDAEATASLIERERITAMNGSDDMFHRLLLTDHDLSSIETAGYGRFNSSLDYIVARADEVGLRLTGIYGMSEVQALLALRNPAEPVELRQRAGGDFASAKAAARIIDPETLDELPLGADGELVLRGPSLFAGYLSEGGSSIDADLTDQAHVTDSEGRRWFRTGDLAHMEPDGTFTYLTRIGDVLRLSGFLVSPAEIEEVIMGCEGIEAAQVVALPRPEGVRPVAFVITAGTANPPPQDPAIEEGAIERAVIEHCQGELAKFKVPIRVFTVDEFPSTPSANGTKIQRTKLRDMAARALRSEP